MGYCAELLHAKLTCLSYCVIYRLSEQVSVSLYCVRCLCEDERLK